MRCAEWSWNVKYRHAVSVMATDSVSILMCQLSTLHLDQALRNSSAVWSHEQKQRKQKKLKSIAFETVFCYLKDHGIVQLVLYLCISAFSLVQ